MTPTQTQQAIRIMQKHGQGGWRIEYCKSDCIPWSVANDPAWNWDKFTYRAVGPRKRVELRRGMEVKTDGTCGLIYRVISGAYPYIVAWTDSNIGSIDGGTMTHYRWPNGDGTWLPIEGEPEIISMEGVE